jgi:hypothetical protein
MNELDRFNPFAWVEDGLVVMGEEPSRSKFDVLKLPVWASSLTRLAAVVGTSAAVLLAGSYVSKVPLGVTGPPSVDARASRGDPDVVDPSYWEKVRSAMRTANLPEDDGEVGPELPDLTA